METPWTLHLSCPPTFTCPVPPLPSLLSLKRVTPHCLFILFGMLSLASYFELSVPPVCPDFVFLFFIWFLMKEQMSVCWFCQISFACWFEFNHNICSFCFVSGVLRQVSSPVTHQQIRAKEYIDIKNYRCETDEREKTIMKEWTWLQWKEK